MNSNKSEEREGEKERASPEVSEPASGKSSECRVGRCRTPPQPNSTSSAARLPLQDDYTSKRLPVGCRTAGRPSLDFPHTNRGNRRNASQWLEWSSWGAIVHLCSLCSRRAISRRAEAEARTTGEALVRMLRLRASHEEDVLDCVGEVWRQQHRAIDTDETASNDECQPDHSGAEERLEHTRGTARATP